jgi:hypothetical protein
MRPGCCICDLLEVVVGFGDRMREKSDLSGVACDSSCAFHHARETKSDCITQLAAAMVAVDTKAEPVAGIDVALGRRAHHTDV